MPKRKPRASGRTTPSADDPVRRWTVRVDFQMGALVHIAFADFAIRYPGATTVELADRFLADRLRTYLEAHGLLDALDRYGQVPADVREWAQRQSVAYFEDMRRHRPEAYARFAADGDRFVVRIDFRMCKRDHAAVFAEIARYRPGVLAAELRGRATGVALRAHLKAHGMLTAVDDYDQVSQEVREWAERQAATYLAVTYEGRTAVYERLLATERMALPR